MAQHWLPTFEEVVNTQLTRTEIAHALVDPTLSMDERRAAVVGHFIRVLIETGPHDENYRAFTVKGLIASTEYSGFSADAATATNLHLELNLPPTLRGTNSVAFQLNCVSNSRLSRQEYDLWATDARGYAPDVLGDTLQNQAQIEERARDLAARRQRSRTQGPRDARPAAGANRNATAAPNRASAANDAAARAPPADNGAPPHALGVTMRADSGSTGIQANPDAAAPVIVHSGMLPARPRGDAAQLPPTLDRLGWKRLIIEDMRETNAVFARPGAHVKLSALRVQERDLEEYAQKLREAMDGRRTVCVCCMTAAPSIITLPCKHKVLCRYCAAKMRQCPVCRETTVEMFEPEDL